MQEPPKLIFCISVSSCLIFFDFMRIPEVRELSFHFNVLCPRVSDIFLCVFPSGRSFSFQGRKKVGLRTNKVYGENTTCNEMEVWRLSP